MSWYGDGVDTCYEYKGSVSYGFGLDDVEDVVENGASILDVECKVDDVCMVVG